MTDAEKREKVIRGIEYCLLRSQERVHCGDCPYWYDDFESGCHIYDMMRDTLSLLKEQEPRVMTLDEVLTAEDFVWAEIYTPNKWSWCVIYVKIIPVVSNDEIVIIGEDYGTGWTKNKADYGKRGFLDGGWRCWSARPTDEQRKEVPWNE